MKRHSDKSIIPKIIVLLGTLSIVGIILLFMRSRPGAPVRMAPPETPEKLFTQVIEAARPEILRLWEEGDRFLPKTGTKCPEEISPDEKVGRSYYQCQPHFWQCYWNQGVGEYPSLEVNLFGQTYHVVARPVFDAIPSYSGALRFYQMFKLNEPGVDLNYGYKIELEVREIHGLSQAMILTDSCRDTYLPQRIYGYGQLQDRREEGFIWDNFDRHLFLDKFYVTNQQVNEWRVLTQETSKIITDRKQWPHPALLSFEDQKKYCAYFGKKVLEAKLFDAATMTPSDLKNSLPEKVLRPETPWQRDLSKTFLGMSRINPDYQLTPLDCQLAQIKGCQETYFTTDSATWMGLHYALGFFPESLPNDIEPGKNLKMSSRFLYASSEWHELGKLSHWKGAQEENLPVAFRCYEEIIP